MTAEEDEESRLSAEAKAALIRELITWGFTIGFIVVMTKRDWFTRQGKRVQRFISNQAVRDAEDIAVQQFRREISAWEHTQADR